MAEFLLAVILAGTGGGALWVYRLRRHPRPLRPPKYRPDSRGMFAGMLHDPTGVGDDRA